MVKTQAQGPRLLTALGAAFILFYHLLFTFDGFNTVFGGDDGMNLMALHKHWDIPMWRSVVDAFTVITSAYRPMGALFYRPMFEIFGYNPLAFRVVFFCLVVFNIWLVYLLARYVNAPRLAAALCCLLFSYNAGMMDMQYNTGTVYDVLCFLFYFPALILYVRRRSTGAPLRIWEMAVALALYMGALDSKELAVSLPGAFLLYEVLYRLRDWKSRKIIVWQGLFLTALLAITGLYVKVKVLEMSSNDAYRPRPSVAFVLGSFGHYFELLSYRRPDSYTVTGVIVTMLVLVAICAIVRSRAAVFGALLFFGALVPLAVIPHRGGFAAYVAYPGLTLAAGCILDAVLTGLVRVTRQQRFQQIAAVVVFLVVAIELGKYHFRVRNRAMDYFHWLQHPLQECMPLMKRTVPDFPPDFRVLMDEDAFPAHDWVIFFLTRMIYGDHTLWLDRTRNLEKPPDRASYDIFMTYTPSYIEAVPLKVFGVPIKWEPRTRRRNDPVLAVTAGQSDPTPHEVTFSRATVKTGQDVKLTLPGIANAPIDVVYRIVSGNKEEVYKPKEWCEVNAASQCTVFGPAVKSRSTLILDWVRPRNGKWRRTKGSIEVQ